MSLQPTDPDLKHELQATLAARRELAPEYDEQFIERLTTRLTEQVREEIAKAPKPHSSALTPEQRIPIAICSLIFGIPLVAIVQSGSGVAGVAIVFAALVLINIAAGISW
ncbi:MAG: hypothetical protein ACLQUY_07640 [Ktedonobacterales bacterium]